MYNIISSSILFQKLNYLLYNYINDKTNFTVNNIDLSDIFYPIGTSTTKASVTNYFLMVLI